MKIARSSSLIPKKPQRNLTNIQFFNSHYRQVNITKYNLNILLRCFDRFRDMNEDRIDANIDEERVPNDIIVQEFPELVSNPFGPQLCRVFSSANDKATMNFEDFLDMCSVLSPNAPIQTKADWAFRVFGEKLLFFRLKIIVFGLINKN